MKEQTQHEVAPTLVNNAQPERNKRDFAVVGIGVTAAGLGSLTRFLKQLPDANGMAYVVVLVGQSQAEMDDALATLSEATRLPVTPVARPTPLELNRVFVVAPGKRVAMSASQLIVSEFEQAPDDDAQLALFYRSLADAHRNHAFGILLDDADIDAAVGLAWIKERGGITLTQRADEGEIDAMPHGAVATAAFDLILPAEDMPQALLARWANAGRIELPPSTQSQIAPQDEQAKADELALREIVMQLRAVTGHDLKHVKRSAILRRIERRMRVTGQPTLHAYSQYLQVAIGESHLLLAELTPGSTYFFRDAEAFETLRSSVLSELFRSAPGGSDIRVWSAGCSTGEEAYSLAMLLCEEAAHQKTPRHVQVFATDANENAISRGRSGRYPHAISADVSPSRLRLFFNHEQGHYKVKHDLREKVLFARHDLLRDPPFTQVDLISCRNVLGDLESSVQRQILRMFHFALRPGGYLLLSPGETADAVAELFTSVDRKHRIYRANLAANIRQSPAEPTGDARSGVLPRIAHPYERRRTSFSDVHQKVLEQYAPPSVIVNDDLEIVHMSENAGRFLGYSGGEPSHNLIKVVHAQLRLELRTALFQALHSNRSIEGRRVSIDRGEQSVMVDLTVKPFRPEEAGPTFALVLFDEVHEAPRQAESAPSDDSQCDIVAQLEAELQRTKEQLQATMEQAEVSTEELRAANEELQAINEELRSATEELEISREELQSVNEELITVNDELKAGMEQTSRANSNLQNLITSTNIATLFVDRNLCINWFTPRAADLFRIIGSDTGRSLLHIAHRLDYDELADDAARVFESLGQIEREVRSEDGCWYLVRHLPYRTNDDRIDGAVLTFIDISGRREAEKKLREEEQLMQLVAESACDYAIITMDPEGNVTSWNRGAEFIFGYSQAEMLGRPADIVFLPEDRRAGAPSEERARAREDGRAEDERWHVRKNGSRLYCSGTVTPLGEGHLRGFVKICRDLTLRKQQAMAQETELERSQTASQRKDQFFAMMSHELKHPLNLVQLNADLLSRLPIIRSSTVMSKASHAILQAVRNQAQIIDDLLDLSRVRTGKLRLKRTAVDLDQVIAEILNSIHNEVVESRLEVSYDPSSAIGMVLHADPTRVEQVVWNLISNALKFTPAGGRIELLLQRQDEMARLDVIDDGPGIDPQHLAQMFDLFDQADNHQALRHKDGLGIGLALVRQLTEAQGGRVEAYSEGLGRGARFTVWLPLLTQPSELPPPNEEQQGGRLEGISIMLVDDSPEVVETLQLLLELEGAIVTTANSGQEALDRVFQSPHRLLITDIGMPEMDGHQLMEAVRSRPEGKTIRGIALTGFASDEDIQRATSAGFDRHIGKPVSMDTLIEAVEAVMALGKGRNR